MSDKEGARPASRMMLDIVVYTLARLVLVVALTAAIFYGAQLVGVQQFPIIIALLFAIVIALPLGIWLLAPLRKRATASIATVDERRRGERDRLQARLRGETNTPE